MDDREGKKPGRFSNFKSKGNGGEKDNLYKDNEFIELSNLVYAPLEALAESNICLQKSILKALEEFGTIKKDGSESIVRLKNTNLSYEHIRSEQDDGYSVEDVQLQVPTISLVPLSNLNVEKAEIDFSAEVHVTKEESNNLKVNARICSPDQRESDFLPRVSYKMKVTSIPATEGMMRITDILSANHVVKQLDSKQLTSEGNMQSEEKQKLMLEKQEIRKKIHALNKLYDTISERIAKIQNMSDSIEEDMSESIAEKIKWMKHVQTEIVNEIMELEISVTEKDIQGETE